MFVTTCGRIFYPARSGADTREMRTITLLIAAVTVFLLPVPAGGITAPADSPAATDPWACWFPPSPGSGWSMTIHRFHTCAQCETAGAAGVSNGEWTAYRCAWVPIGLDGDYFLFLPSDTARAAAPDPYLDGLAPQNEIAVDDAANLTGAPDGRFATVHGRLTKFLVLDLGAGEEGIGDLEVHYALQPGDVLGMVMDVHFLDRNGKRLGQGQLGMIGSGPRVTTVDNPSSKPYRYLKILTGLNTVLFDSMKAAAPAE
ncbi:hypothetical protein [Actinophytocola algeriensis]|uniref:Uncharacterized protein n=1 Tax=Actinophytocola algeriensis TaxID=1768010 RepID=A0A7W7Q392_9PSEU|nr:hypothetical protein [Actinophytocola algeriensis]MBB4905981.1 hypothetical protein [Actinophytocola algeriensis]MBE1472334.1 hypothetical protein [Actinophytocola algeriensis]